LSANERDSEKDFPPSEIKKSSKQANNWWQAASEIKDTRELRVFISSTFRDMMRERDLLVKQVFPELRRKCAQRFVTFTEVDLRWGITEEQASEGQVLPLCLAEIERSRPYFIGLLGERYGWIPDDIGPEVLEREPWLKEYISAGASVTELEILHGVLKDPKMESLAFFYFRDPNYVNDPSLSDQERLEMLERDIPADLDKYGKAGAARRTEERKSRLAALKNRIRESKLPLVENYSNPEAVAEIIREQFEVLIDYLYPETEVPDPIVQERLAHEAFARQKLFACIERPGHLARLNAYVSNLEQENLGLVVTGNSGGGKTALLADWARNWATAHPEDLVFQHYFGATTDSASTERFIRRLLEELKINLDIEDDIPTDPSELREALPAWLLKSSGNRNIILVLDGLDQIQGREPDLRLSFLPRKFPANVKVIASTLPGPALDTLQSFGWHEHTIKPADQSEVNAMVDKYLDIHARSLEPVLRQQLVSSPGVKNPLYLRTLLEELRQFGSFEQLPDQLACYLEADNPRELFGQVIRRWQEDFDKPGSGNGQYGDNLVCRALSHLWASHQGLSETEWLELLGDVDGGEAANSSDNDLPIKDKPLSLPRAYWTPFFLALEPHLCRRAGLLNFGHDFLRQAVEDVILNDGQTRKAAHLTVANYFEHHPGQRNMSPRKAAEWPYQLYTAEDWERLEKCLTYEALFMALFNEKTRWELTYYWLPLRRQGWDMGECYTTAHWQWIKKHKKLQSYHISFQVGDFLLYNGLYSSAEPLLRRATDGFERMLGPEHADTLKSLNSLASLLDYKGDHADSEVLHSRALEISERVKGPNHPDTLVCLNNLAMLLLKKKKYNAAEPLFRRALAGCEQYFGINHRETLVSMNNLAMFLAERGEHFSAEALYKQALEGCEKVLGLHHPETLSCMNNLAMLYLSKGDYLSAEPFCQRVFETRKEILGPMHPETLLSANNLGKLLSVKGEFDSAEHYYRQALKGYTEVFGSNHPDTFKIAENLAETLMNKGDLAAAEKLYRKAFEMCKQLWGMDYDTTLVLANGLIRLLEKKGDYISAEQLYRQTVKSFERLLGQEHPQTLETMNRMALLLIKKGDYEEAEQLFNSVLEAGKRVFGPEHPYTLIYLNNLAGLLEKKGNYKDAEALYTKALKGLLKISEASRQLHPYLKKVTDNYARCLHLQGYDKNEIQKIIKTIGRQFDLSFIGQRDKRES